MNVKIEFLEPIRMIPWCDDSHRDHDLYKRGNGFAKWHKKNEKQGGPFITGTLVRSAVIRAAEKYLVIHDGLVDGIPCCKGLFHTEVKPEDMKQDQQPILKPKHIRQRATYTWTDHHKKCSKKDLCPLCELIGRFDRAGKRARKKDGGFHFHFGNFLLPQRFGFEKETEQSPCHQNPP